MADDELTEIRQAAEKCRLTVSEWVRLALREARDADLRAGPQTVREPPTRYGEDTTSLPHRVHVELDVREDLLETVRERYHLPSQRAAVEYALRRAAVRPMTKDEALAMEGVGWAGDLDELRSGDPGAPW